VSPGRQLSLRFEGEQQISGPSTLDTLQSQRRRAAPVPSGFMAFKNLNRSLSVERTRVVFFVTRDLYACMVRVNS